MKRSSPLQQLARAAKVAQQVRTSLPKAARAAEDASALLRDGSKLLADGAALLRRWSTPAAEKITVKAVR